MDLYTALFWIGFIVLFLTAIVVEQKSWILSVVVGIGAFSMFVGSKIGRAFLGISS